MKVKDKLLGPIVNIYIFKFKAYKSVRVFENQIP